MLPNHLALVLFRKEAKQAVTRVNRLADNGFQNTQYQTFVYENKQFKDISAQVFPTIPHQDFFKSKVDLAPYHSLLNSYPICIDLSRYGRTAKAKISMSPLLFACQHENNSDTCTIKEQISPKCRSGIGLEKWLFQNIN